MGRSSREKRERRLAASREVDLTGGFENQSLLALLEAASVSPTASTRLGCISAILHAVVSRRKEGNRLASATDLLTLLDAARERYPETSVLEDFLPHDVRAPVFARWGERIFRLAPGALERPVAMVRRQEMLASIIDETLVEARGYGLRDVTELVLARVGQVTTTLSPTWLLGPPDDPAEPPLVTDPEVAAAAGLPSFASLVDNCSAPLRAERALRSHATRPKHLQFELGDLVSTFGTAIAVATGGTQVPLPAGVMIESLPAIGAELAAVARLADPELDRRFEAAVIHRMGLLFEGLRVTIIGPVRVGSGPIVHALVEFSPTQLLAINVATGLGPEVIQEHLTRGDSALGTIKPGVSVRNPQTEWDIPPDAEVVHLHLVAGPESGTPMGAGAPCMDLQDLEWILHSSQETPVDLWHFVRDMQRPAGFGSMFAWDMIDRWEVWRGEKSFFRGGKPVASIFVSPHASVVEWDDAAELAPMELALHTLSLPPLHHWPIRIKESTSTGVVAAFTEEVVLNLHLGSAPVAIRQTDPSGPRDLADTLWNLADGMTWKLAHIADGAWERSAEKSGTPFLHVHFRFLERDAGPTLTAESLDQTTLVLGWDHRLQDELVADSLAVEELCGRLIADTLHPEVRPAFIDAWNAAPPGVRVDGFPVQQQARDLPQPLESHGSYRSTALRSLGEMLADAGIEPSILEGADATQFESRTVFPWLLAELQALMARWDPGQALAGAMVHLERCHYHRAMLDLQIGWQRGFPVHDASQINYRREKSSRAIRTASLILEELIAHPPNGSTDVDEAEWTRALALAELCIESCFRSDEIHQRLTHKAVEVTDLFEVLVHDSSEPTDVNLDAYNQARVEGTMPAAVPIGASSGEDEEDDDEEPQALLELMPELSSIDEALKANLGFGLDALTGLLNVARQWPATSDQPATPTTPEEFVAEAAQLAVGANLDEYTNALDWLTLRTSDLAEDVIPHWETERRHKRVLTSPYVDINGALWVLPWTAESTIRVVSNYLGDGRLPWPESAFPDAVNTAVMQYRQARNRQAERDCVSALTEAGGLIVRESIKKEKAEQYGFDKLTGEIDAICIDEERSRIWVIEAKDPFTPYSYRQIRRLINDFHKPGKYVDQLLLKVEDTRRCAKAVALALGADRPDRDWEVIGIMATRHPEPAAFAVDARVPFCVIDDLNEVIRSDSTPDAGYCSA